MTSLTDPGVTAVRSPVCLLCDAALDTLDRLRERVPLRLRVPAARWEDGQRLVAGYRAAMRLSVRTTSITAPVA